MVQHFSRRFPPGLEDEIAQSEKYEENFADVSETSSMQDRSSNDLGAAPVDIQKIQEPMAFQKVGNAVFKDPTPTSHRAQHPWGLIHERETTLMVKELIQTVIDPQVEQVRSYKLSPSEEISLNFKTEYLTTEKDDSGLF